MDKDQIHWWDLHRILIGQAPTPFLLEVFIRSLVLYILALIAMRWLGKRMNGQLSILELAIMVMMGATIGSPIQLPDRGLLQGLVILLALLVLMRTVNLLIFLNPKIESLLNGKLTVLVKDGIIQKKAIRCDRVSKPQLYAILRTHGIFNLGRVNRVYLEAYGSFSIYERKEQRPGLLLYPELEDKELPPHRVIEDALACSSCGHVEPGTDRKRLCPQCGEQDWVKPIMEEK